MTAMRDRPRVPEPDGNVPAGGRADPDDGRYDVIRLDRFLCEAGAGTRSQAKALIKAGRVSVDGERAISADLKIEENRTRVLLDGRPLFLPGNVYYLLNKPAGVITAASDARERTVMDLLKEAPGRGLFPVGRLDRDTVGLLLITNDGALSHRLLSPSRHVEKRYLVRTARPVTEEMCRFLEAGVDIGDEKPTLPARTERLKDEPCGLYLTITEGRYHQVKRMLAAAGNEVTGLKRVSMGPLSLEETLPEGAWRELTKEERNALGV